MVGWGVGRGQHKGVHNHRRRTTWGCAVRTAGSIPLSRTQLVLKCRGKTTWGRSLHTAGYIPLSRTHHVLYIRSANRARTTWEPALHTEATFLSLALTMCYIHRGRTTLMRCSLHTAGYILVSRTHSVLHTQREDNTDEVFSSHSWLHSCLSHSPCATYTEGGQHWWGVLFTQQATFPSLALTMCTYTEGGQHWWGVLFTQQATFPSLTLTMCTYTEGGQHWWGVLFTQQATFLSLAFTMCYIHSADRRGATWGRRQSSKEDNTRACTSHRGYIPVSCIHYVLHAVQREDSMWACTSHRGYIPVSCIHHVLHTVQRKDNM